MIRYFFYLSFCFFLIGDMFCFADDAEQRIIERYREILIKSPKRGTTFDRVYDYYSNTGQIERFYNDCQSAAQQNPAKAAIQLLFGLVAERRNKSAEAVVAFQSAAKFEPNNHLPLLYLGELLLTDRKLPEAITALEQARTRLQNKTGNRNDLQTVMQTLATAYARGGEAQKSLGIWQELADLFPDDPDVLGPIAESMEREGKFDEAGKLYRRLIALTEDPAEKVRLTLAAIDIPLRQSNIDAAKKESALNELNLLLGSLDSESYLADGIRDRIENLFERSNDLIGLIEFYQKRIKQAPNDTASLLRLVRTLQQADKSVEAEKLLVDTIQNAPSNIQLRLMLIDFFVNRKDIGKAVEQFQAIEEIKPLESEHLVRWGRLVLQNTAMPEAERKTEAVKIWNRIAENAPNDPNACISSAELFARHQFYPEAERCYIQAIELRPNDFLYRERLATFYVQQGTKDKAVVILLPKDEQFVITHRADIGQLLLTFGSFPEAAAMLNQAVKAAPQNATLQCKYLESLLRQNTPESILAAQQFYASIEKQIADDEQFAFFLQQEVQLLRTLQRITDALTNVQSQSAASPSIRSLWHLAVLHQAEGEIPSAIQIAENGLKQPSPPLPLRRLAAELYEQSGNTDRAIVLYQELMQLDPPRSGNYLQHIITLHIQRGELPKALELSQKLLGSGTENAERLRFVAELFLSVNRNAEAIKLLRQALVLEPDNTDVLRILAQTLSDMQQQDEAVELLWRLYERHKNFVEKISVIEILTNEYRKQGKDAELLGLLQQMQRKPEQRQNAMLALARVHIILGADNDARSILKNLLEMPRDEQINIANDSESVSHWILRELVSIAEKREEYADAVRYQEMLCQTLTDPREQNHLFTLYDKLGDTAKTHQLFFDQVLRQGDWQGRFELIDTMIRSGQYEIVSQVLDFLTIHESAHWGVLLRQIMVEAYQNKPVERLVQQFRSEKFEEVPVSAGIKGVPESFIFSEIAPARLNESLVLQSQFLQMIFKPKDANYTLSDVRSFEDARFLALGFLIQESMQKDLAANGTNPTVMRQFRNTIEALRSMLSLESSKNEVLIERLRLEVWLLDLLKFDERNRAFPSGMIQLQIDPRLCQQSIEQVIRKSALAGVDDWQPALFHILLTECINELITNQFKAELTSDARLSAKLVQMLDTLCFERRVPPMPADERNKMISEAAYRIKRSASDYQANLRNHPLTLEQKTNQLVTLWKKFSEKTLFPDHFAALQWILRSQNRKTDMQSLNEFVRKSAQTNPVWYAKHILAFTQFVDENILLFNTLLNYDSLEIKFQRVKSVTTPVLPFCTDNNQKELFCNALFNQLDRLLWGTHLSRYDIFTTADRALLDWSPDQIWSSLQNYTSTQQGRFLRELFGIEPVPASFRIVLTSDQMNRLVELDTALQQISEFSSFVLNELKIEPPNSAVTLSAPVEQRIALARYRLELQGDRPIDRSTIYSLLQNPAGITQFSAVEQLFCRILLLRRAMDTKTRFAAAKTEGKTVPIQGKYVENFRQYLENKTRSTFVSDRAWSSLLSVTFGDILTMESPASGQAAAPGAETELLLLIKKLEAEQQNHPLTNAETIGMALLYVRLQRFAEAVRTLDSLELTVATDLQLREWIIARLVSKLAKPQNASSVLYLRGREAAGKLLNFPLSERDMLALVPILQRFERVEDSEQLWDNLVETISDRRLLSEMLYKMVSEGEPQKENAAKIARRILLNPSFLQNTRRLTSDVHLMESAIKVLSEQNKAKDVVPILENRLRNIQNQTDSQLLLVRMYLLLGRQAEAKKLTLELAKHPTAEPERHQMIVSLLVHFGLQKELETMNRLLIERQ